MMFVFVRLCGTRRSRSGSTWTSRRRRSVKQCTKQKCLSEAAKLLQINIFCFVLPEQAPRTSTVRLPLDASDAEARRPAGRWPACQHVLQEGGWVDGVKASETQGGVKLLCSVPLWCVCFLPGPRSRYVDVLNPGGTTKPGGLAPPPADIFAPLAPMAMPANLFVPSSGVCRE